MQRHFFFIPLLFVFLISAPVLAQNDRVLYTDTIPEIDLEQDTTQYANPFAKKKKRKKKVFYGMKCKKGFTKVGVGDRQVIEIFYFLKVYKEPNSYVGDIYVYDIMKAKIIKVDKIDEKQLRYYKVLHGPYKKMQGGNIIEEGIFYVGTKHGRWERYDKDYILLNKTKYYKGWPREAKITYHDAERKKVKEVDPYEYGVHQGDYYYFSESGQVLVKGQYENGQKVGVWVEYFKDRNKRQREIKYPDDPYDKTTKPVIQKEWNEKGNVIILNGEEVKPGQNTNDDPIKRQLRRGR